MIGKDISKKLKFPEKEKKLIDDDVDIALHLATEYNVAFAPLSLFGVPRKKGLLRITCSMMNEEFERVHVFLKRLRNELSIA